MASPDMDTTSPDARDELNSLLQTLHEQGLLRLANDLAASNSQWLPALREIVDESADVEQLRNAMPALVETAGLLQALHQQGLLRLAHDAVVSREQWAPALGEILDDYLNDDRNRRALQNLSVAFTSTLSRIEPDQLSKLLLAFGESLEYIATYKPDKDKTTAPGVISVFRLLRDDALWRTLTPVIEALKVFGAELEKEVDQSSMTHSGSSTRT